MSRGLNKVMLIGNVGNKHDIITTKIGGKILNFTVATNVVVRDKESGKSKNIPEWHSITVFDKLAEVIDKYAKKGSKLYVEGYLKTETFTNKHNQEVKATKIVANTINMLDKKEGDSFSHEPNGNVDHGYGNGLPKDDQFDDDIPF